MRTPSIITFGLVISEIILFITNILIAKNTLVAILNIALTWVNLAPMSLYVHKLVKIRESEEEKLLIIEIVSLFDTTVVIDIIYPFVIEIPVHFTIGNIVAVFGSLILMMELLVKEESIDVSRERFGLERERLDLERERLSLEERIEERRLGFDEVRFLKELKDMGILSEDEFKERVKRILEKMD